MQAVIQGTAIFQAKESTATNAFTRIRNKANLKPFDLVDPRNKDLRSALQKAEYSMQVGDDVIQEDDDDPTGSGSESD